MIKKYSDLEINDVTISHALKTIFSPTSTKNKINQVKYLIIDSYEENFDILMKKTKFII